MGRTYVRKTTKGAGQKYTRRSLELALEDVKSHRRTRRGAAKFYEIPRTTLKHYLDGTRGNGCVAGTQGNKGGGGKLQLGVENEAKLVEGIKTMEKWGFGLSRAEVLDVVQTFVNENDIKTRFKGGRPGEEWFLLFTKRHKLSIKRPQAVEAARMKQINPFTVYGFYDLLSDTIKKLELENKPWLIFNCDETSFRHDPEKTKVVGAKGTATIRLTASCGRENTSVLLCVSASGAKLPPLCVFKGQNILESWVSRSETDRTAYCATKKGWMESHIFLKWFTKCFLLSVPEERPILLIYDGHVSHVSCDLIKTAQENDIHIIKLPPHTTHRLQPLDVSVNKSMKDRFDQELVKFQRSNPRKRIPKHLFVDILNKCLEAVPTSVVTNGFRRCGIYDTDHLEKEGTPVNPSAIGNNLFLPEDIRRYEAYQLRRQKERELGSTNQNTDQSQENAGEEIGDFEPLGGNQEKDQRRENAGEDVGIQDGNLSEEENEKTEAERTIEINNNYYKENYGDKTEKAETKANCSFENILLSYVNTSGNSVQANTQIKRRRICTGAELITKEDYLKKIEGENKIKEQRMLKKTKAPIKHITGEDMPSTSTTNNNSDIEKVPTGLSKKVRKEKDKKGKQPITKKRRVSLSSDSSGNFENSKSSESDSEIVGPVAIEEDYVIVYYNGLYFPGRVTERDKNRVKVTCFEKYGKLGDSWRWPKVEDSIWYDDEEVVKIIPPPQLLNKRGIYDVPSMNRYVE